MKDSGPKLLNQENPHTVFAESGPACDIHCPGLGTEYHHGYVVGYRAGADIVVTQVLTALPAPAGPIKPEWIQGPTRTSWFREGVNYTFNFLGFAPRWPKK